MGEWASVAIAGFWTAFLATHVGLSSQRWRPRLVRRLGPTGFLGVYSLVSLMLFVPLVWIYAQHKHAGAFWWYGSVYPWMRPIVYLGIALAMTLIVGSFFNPSPASIAPGPVAVRGVLRVTRHPLFMGVGLLGLLHLFVARVHTSDLVFFVGLPIVGLIGCWHQDQRKRASEGEVFQAFFAQTSFLPFGRGGLAGLIESPTALVLGVGITFLLRWFHPQIFGGSA